MKALRLALPGVAMLASLLAGQVVVSAQPPFAISAGQYHTVAEQSGFFNFDPVTSMSVNVNVTDTKSTSAPTGSRSTTTETTQLQFGVFGNDGGVGGCYNIAPSDLTFGVTVVTLHTTITSANVSCDPFGNVALPVTIDATLTASGPVFTSGQGSQFSCGGYRLETTVSTVNTGANGTATITPVVTGSLTGQGNIRSDDTRQHAQGVEPDNCQPYGAQAGGIGPPPAGTTTDSLVMADFFVQNPGDWQPSLDVAVTKDIQTSVPKVGSPSSTTQFQVNIVSTSGGFEFGCFTLDSSQFSNNGVQGASLSATFDQNSPLCFPGGQVTLPLPLTVNVVWTGTGPIATTHSVGDLTCLTYRDHGEGVTQTNNESVTATISPLLADPITAVGTMQTNSSTAHQEGAQQPACHL
ncbi:MAG TPA: hypothetical protein VI384_03665 [Candidatus Dormibacteraeota bacterium]